MITKEQEQELLRLVDCLEAQARAAAENPDPHNLIQLGGTLCSVRRTARELRTAALKLPVLELAPLASDEYNDGLRDGFNEAIQWVLKLNS